MQYIPWLVERLKGIPPIVDAADEWLKKHDAVLTREVSFFARVGGTEIGKQRLLEGLSQSSPFWCVEALLDQWGMEDQEVFAALTNLANSPRAAEIGHLLPRIIPEPEVCHQRLVSLLDDPKCQRPDLVLEGLARLGGTPNRDELVSMAMPFTERETLWDMRVKNVLFSNFSDCRQVKDLARRQLSIHEGNLAGVVQFFGSDRDLLGGVLASLNPLPVALRSKIITFLCSHRSSPPWVYDLFAQYDLEADPGIKTQMAIAHYQDLVESGEDLYFYQQVYFHKLGTDPKQDTYVIGKEFPRIAEVQLRTSVDGRWLIASVANGDGGEIAHYVMDSSGHWTQISHFADGIVSAQVGANDVLYLLTRKDAPRGRILAMPLSTPTLSQAKVVVQQSSGLGADETARTSIESFAPSDSGLFLIDMMGGPSILRVYDDQGHSIATIDPPVSAINQIVPIDHGDVLLSISSFLEPTAWWQFDSKQKKLSRTALFRTFPENSTTRRLCVISPLRKMVRAFPSASSVAKGRSLTALIPPCWRRMVATESASRHTSSDR